MSGREQNKDSYIPGKGMKMKNRKDFTLKGLKESNNNDPEAQGIPWQRVVKEDKAGNVIEIGKKEALNILSKGNDVAEHTFKLENKKCPHCGGELP